MKRTIKRKKEEKKELTILTNDPSMTAWGWAVIKNDKVVEGGCIETEPNSKTNRIRKGDDRVRRIHEINIILLEIIQRHKVNFLISELPHGSQNAAAAVMVGMCADKVQTIGDCLDIPVEWYSENDAKKHIVGKKKISKDDMVKEIDSIYTVEWLGSKKRNSGLADAIAVYHVAKAYSSIIQFHLNQKS